MVLLIFRRGFRTEASLSTGIIGRQGSQDTPRQSIFHMEPQFEMEVCFGLLSLDSLDLRKTYREISPRKKIIQFSQYKFTKKNPLIKRPTWLTILTSQGNPTRLPKRAIVVDVLLVVQTSGDEKLMEAGRCAKKTVFKCASPWEFENVRCTKNANLSLENCLNLFPTTVSTSSRGACQPCQRAVQPGKCWFSFSTNVLPYHLLTQNLKHVLVATQDH